ncbi:MAG: putative selenate reductase subunit YgfK [Suipraeoptans sp.]
MSDIMTPMPISELMEWVIKEKENDGSVFGVYRPYHAKSQYNRTIFGRTLETPIGPAAGPQTQLAQNIIASYYSGSRFFELKTVQVMDGAELAACVNKPCINADDECYNVEWSTELYVPQAMNEYIKAWFVLKVMAIEFELGAIDGFQFNISVGYDLEGIKSEKINTFIDSMMDASITEVFKECKQYLLDNIDMFEKFSLSDVDDIAPEVCNSVTISTLHGCPPQEIEKIASYLLEEKKINTFIKCNPTLLGYDYARKTMDEMGYDYVVFGEFHFLDDLQYVDAIPMLTRLMDKSDRLGLEFGVKITNTFPVDIKQNELPGEEMYMSGKSLYALSIEVANRLAKEFEGKLRIAYSGGADFHNIKKIIDAGIWPVTVATTLLKPGGYQRVLQLVEETKDVNVDFTGISAAKTQVLSDEAKVDAHYTKAIKPLPERKIKKKVPLVDCFMAPCKEGCPINQDITQYIELTAEGQYEKALEVIMSKNPLPFITGTICPHNCMSKCTRNFYEEPVQIRSAKLVAATNGYDKIMKKLSPKTTLTSKKVAIVGGGPAGLSAAYFLAKGGLAVTIYEKEAFLGGVVKRVIPEFRISSDSIDKDIALIMAMGVEARLNTEIRDIKELKESGYDYIILAIGAGKAGTLNLEGKETINAIDFLTKFKKNEGTLNVGKNIVVIGGGNTAMDTARAAKRIMGVEKVSLVYRRTRRFMPADEEELVMALEDGVEFRELLAPKMFEDEKLVCTVQKLGEYDASGRRSVVSTDEEVIVDADTVIVAVGESVDDEFYSANGVKSNTLESNVQDVFVIGDGLGGPATVVEGIRDANLAATAILGKSLAAKVPAREELQRYYDKRGILGEHDENTEVDDRCLGCASVCENCAEVCPNRANIAIRVPELLQHQIIHVDSMCNECGNCKSFCPYESAPYLDKFTLFTSCADMDDSKNEGFVVLDERELVFRVRYLDEIFTWSKEEHDKDIPEELGMIMETVCKDYRYLWS